MKGWKRAVAAISGIFLAGGLVVGTSAPASAETRMLEGIKYLGIYEQAYKTWNCPYGWALTQSPIITVSANVTWWDLKYFNDYNSFRVVASNSSRTSPGQITASYWCTNSYIWLEQSITIPAAKKVHFPSTAAAELNCPSDQPKLGAEPQVSPSPPDGVTWRWEKAWNQTDYVKVFFTNSLDKDMSFNFTISCLAQFRG
ncbi:hypothetical protein [Acrocarpospora catenulata]|uniref:hypothetical protein n=1 Tax=Acrocarpospora catenulata TaxID=2836182 RepID=UPI001BDB028C|nr:hypothetical protein [Acrocarpospora catenulata]